MDARKSRARPIKSEQCQGKLSELSNARARPWSTYGDSDGGPHQILRVETAVNDRVNVLLGVSCEILRG